MVWTWRDSLKAAAYPLAILAIIAGLWLFAYFHHPALNDDDGLCTYHTDAGSYQDVCPPAEPSGVP